MGSEKNPTHSPVLPLSLPDDIIHGLYSHTAIADVLPLQDHYAFFMMADLIYCVRLLHINP